MHVDGCGKPWGLCECSPRPAGKQEWIDENMAVARSLAARSAANPREPLDVDALPRREAHALFALFAWCHENPNSIPTASEVCLFDEEATGPRATGSALQRAARRGLCICGGGRYWAPVGAALVAGRQPFEDRVARDLGWPE